MVTGQGAKGDPKSSLPSWTIVSQLSVRIGGPARSAATNGRGAWARRRPQANRRRMGPDDKHVVDEAAADRGRKVWAAECINCHGTYARGTDNGPNLIRSELVLHDRYGDHIGPFLRKGTHDAERRQRRHSHRRSNRRPLRTSSTSAYTTPARFAHLRHARYSHRRRPAGKAYFNGAGRCSTCHSPTGDLKGIGAKYDPRHFAGAIPQSPALPLGEAVAEAVAGRWPRIPAAKQVTLTVTPPVGTVRDRNARGFRRFRCRRPRRRGRISRLETHPRSQRWSRTIPTPRTTNC